jgi:putative transposase
MKADAQFPSRKPYPSDLSDEQWDLIADLIPAPNSHPNFPEASYERREIVNGIVYLLRTGCQWRHMPHDLPPWQLVASYYYKWKKGEVLVAVLDRLRGMARAAEGRSATPTLGIIDSQSAKTTEVAAERGFDAGKKGEGQKAPHPRRRMRTVAGSVRVAGERARP